MELFVVRPPPELGVVLPFEDVEEFELWLCKFGLLPPLEELFLLGKKQPAFAKTLEELLVFRPFALRFSSVTSE